MANATKNSGKNEGEHHAEGRTIQAANHDPRRRKANRMTIFLSVVTLAVFGVLASIAVANWQKGGLGNYWHAFGWGFAAYIFLGLGSAFTYYYAIIKPAKADLRARARREQTARMERPELFVEHATPDRIVAGQPVRMRLIVRNRGKMTAHKVRIGATHGLFKSVFDGPLIYNTIPSDVSPSIGADAGFEYISVSSWKIKRQHLVDLKAGSLRMFHYGKGTYEDEAGNQFMLQFCAMFEPTLSTMVLCPDKYLPTSLTDVPERPERRPEISLESASGYCKPGKRAEVKAVFMNRGQATAYDLEMRGTTYFAPAKTFKVPIEHAPKEPAVTYPALAPGARMTGWTEGLGRVLSIGDVHNIVAGELLFLHYTDGRYKDEHGNVYTIEFCLVYEPNRKVMKIAPRAFWPQNTA
jgi:hypothetical protein